MPKKTSIHNILILEDEEFLAKAYQKKLKSSGYSVKCAKSIDDLEKLIRKFKPDLALLDYGLGEERNGLTVIPTIKTSAPNARIVVLSNYSEFNIKKEATDAGADDCLLKIDTTPPVLLDYVKKL